MRAWQTAHTASRIGDDTLMALRLDEPGYSDVPIDATGSYTWTMTGLVNAYPGLYSVNSSSRSRNFDGVNDYADAAADTAARDALRGDSGFTVEAWIETDSVAGNRYVIALLGSTSTEADNALFALRTAGDEINVFWETGTSSNISNTTSGAGLATGTVYHVAAIVKPTAAGTAGNVDLVVIVRSPEGDTYFREEFTDLTASTGGTTSDWCLAYNARSSTELFNGRIDDLRVTSVALDEEAIRWTYLTAVSDWDEEHLTTLDTYQPRARALIEDGDGEFVDVTDLAGWDWLVSCDWGEDIDSNTMDATVELFRSIDGYSLAPDVEDSAINLNGAGSYDQFLALKRKIKIETAVVPDGRFSGGLPEWVWVQVFYGQIDSIGWGDETIVLQCRDQYADLQDTFIESVRTYSSGSTDDVETVIQEIIDDNEPASVGYSFGVPTLYTPNSPSWTVVETQVGRQPAGDAIVGDLSDAIGWDLRYRWDSDRVAYRLTLSEPDRDTTTSLHTFADGEVLQRTTVDIDLAEIKNVCEVGILSTDTETDGGDTVDLSVTVSDTPSINKYGRRWCGISSAWNLDSTTEQTALATAIVKDLREPKATHEIAVRYFRPVELGDLCTLAANGVHSSADKNVAVTSYRHQFSADGAITTIGLRGQPSSGTRRHLRRLIQPGLAADMDSGTLTQATNVTATKIPSGIELAWDWSGGRRGSRQLDYFEVHQSTANGFTPDDTTLVGVTRGNRIVIPGLSTGTNYRHRIIARDTRRISAAASAQLTSTTRTLYQAPAFRAYRSTTQSLSGTGTAAATVLEADSESYDVGGDHNTSTHKWVRSETGVSDFSAQVRVVFGAAVAYGDVYLEIRTDGGTTVARSYELLGLGTTDVILSLSAPARTVGDSYQCVIVWNQSKLTSGTIQAGEYVSWWSGTLTSEDD